MAKLRTALVATTVDDVVDVLAEEPAPLLIAGGTDAMVEINEGHRRLADDTVVVALNRVTELRSWSLDPDRGPAGTLRLGAAVTYGEIERSPLAEFSPALAQAARTVGSPQIRSAATVGGNLATCSPAGDGLPPLVAHDAVVEIAGPHGRRRVPIGEFIVGVKRTALEPGELIVAVEIPLLDGWQGYSKVGIRDAMVISIASVCVAFDGHGRSVRVALGSVAPTIVRATAAEQLLADAVDWEQPTSRLPDELLAATADAAAAASSPIDDHRSTAAYRRHCVGVLTRRLVERATEEQR